MKVGDTVMPKESHRLLSYGDTPAEIVKIYAIAENGEGKVSRLLETPDEPDDLEIWLSLRFGPSSTVYSYKPEEVEVVS